MPRLSLAAIEDAECRMTKLSAMALHPALFDIFTPCSVGQANGTQHCNKPRWRSVWHARHGCRLKRRKKGEAR